MNDYWLNGSHQSSATVLSPLAPAEVNFCGLTARHNGTDVF